MMDKLTICVAAFFRSRAINFVTGKEFINEISLNLRWMSKRDAEYLLSVLVERNILKKDGDYFKPVFDVLSVKNIPIGYKPEQNFINELRSNTPSRNTKESTLSLLMVEAERQGIKKEDFMSEVTMIRDKLGIDILVAGLITLKSRGVNVDDISDTIYERISNCPNSS